jgi:uncharacterized protein YggE
MRLTAIVVAASVVAVLGVLGAYVLGRSGSSRTFTDASSLGITVNGTATVESVPNEADLTLGVSTNASTAKDASSANAAEMTKVIGVLKAHGIDPADIQTDNISVSPTYNNDGTKITGFTASNSVDVHVHKIADAGSIVDAALAAGANQISGPTLTSSNQPDLSRVALMAAMADARKRAEAIASAANVTLGDLLSAQESSSSPPIEFGAAKAAVAGAAPTPVEPGKIQTEADVTVVYGIK